MPPKDIYKDDIALSNFLDNLIGAAQPNNPFPNDNSSPNNPFPKKSSPYASHVSSAVTFETTQLDQAISLVNEHLSQGRQFPLLPALTNAEDNLPQILASSLSTIVRLSKCCQANVNLRHQAEHLAQDTQFQIQNLSRSLEVTKEKVEKKESALAQSKAILADVEAKRRCQIRQLAAENTELKRLVTNATHRENHLNFEAKKREKQFSHLQQRVHTLMSSSKKLSIEQDISAGERGGLHMECVPQRKSRSGEHMDEQAAQTFAVDVAVLEENRMLKGLIRDVHLELDDMFERFPNAFAFLFEAQDDPDGTSLDSDAEGSIHKVPAPAPAEERMNLPYDVIRDEVESSLNDKLNTLRYALGSYD